MGGVASGAGEALSPVPSPPETSDCAGSGSAPPRPVAEMIELQRLDGDRLFHLNASWGLMVFDVGDVDTPRLLGRLAIDGTPVETVVRNGSASGVVADRYGADKDGQPFSGSVVRGIDATDPAYPRSLGEARLGGWVRDARVVGDVPYAVTEDHGSLFGGYCGIADGRVGAPRGAIAPRGSLSFLGYVQVGAPTTGVGTWTLWMARPRMRLVDLRNAVAPTVASTVGIDVYRLSDEGLQATSGSFVLAAGGSPPSRARAIVCPCRAAIAEPRWSTSRNRARIRQRRRAYDGGLWRGGRTLRRLVVGVHGG